MARDRGDFEEHLRRRLVGLLHAGRLKPGDRLESIRSLARDRGIDHRVVAAAYRALEADGLVAIRGNSGVYVAEPGMRDGLSSEVLRWVTEVLHDGWKRGWSRGEVGRLVRRAGSRKLRCGCIESNEDHMVAFASELSTDFDLSVTEIHIEAGAEAGEIPETSFAGMDVLVTSVFHAEVARGLSATMTRPIIVLTIDDEYSAGIDARLRGGGTTTVAVDAGYVERGGKYLKGTVHENQVQFLLLEEAVERGIDMGGPDVLLTRAARRRLGLEEFHLIAPPPGVISSASARAVLHEITRLSIRGSVAIPGPGSPAGPERRWSS
jgi:DNA-binding transcriptional regulator YhcF (GntR family)